MTVFEHSFTLIGLVLGLAMADVLSGLVRNARGGVKSLGLLTPMLAVFVVADITTFWGILWDTRSRMPESIWPVLGFSILLSGIYYSAAALVWPDSRERWPDLDAYYMRYRRVILGLMFLCFALVLTLTGLLRGAFTSDPVALTYIVVLGLTVLAPWKSANVVGLAVLIAVDIWAFWPVAAS